MVHKHGKNVLASISVNPFAGLWSNNLVSSFFVFCNFRRYILNGELAKAKRLTSRVSYTAECKASVFSHMLVVKGQTHFIAEYFR